VDIVTPSDIPVLTFHEAPTAPETMNVLLYGHPKSGKSTAAATAPGPILWLNAEGAGALGYARKTAAERKTEIHEVMVDKTNATHVLEAVWQHLHAGLDPKPRTVVMDTVGKVRDALAAQIGGKQPTIQQWGQVAEKLGGFILFMRDQPMNLILLAHADVKDDDDAGRIVEPMIGGKLTRTVPGEVDVVSFTSAVRTEGGMRYYGQLVEGKGRIAGDRSGVLADERGVRELDMSEWLRAYSAGLNTETDLPWAGQLTVEDALGDQPPPSRGADVRLEGDYPPAGAGVMFDPDLED
jgi:hypothetical protein